MAGELFLAQFQIGKETTPGTLVAATRKLYYALDSGLTVDRDPRPWAFATGTRDNVRAFTVGPQMVAGQLKQPLSEDEIIELASMAIQTVPTPTTPGGGTNSRLYTFKPANTVTTGSLEWNDGARGWVAVGAQVEQLQFDWSANGSIDVTADVFARTLAIQALTASIADRTPTFIEGWETKVYIDAFAATPGTTVQAGTVVSGSLTYKNNLGRKFWSDNVNATGGVVAGNLEITGSLLIEASKAQAATEYANWVAGTKRLLRLECGNNVIIEAALKRFVTFDIPCAISGFDLVQEDQGTRMYEMKFQYVYDPTNAFGFQLRAQNARPTSGAGSPFVA